MGEIKFEKKTLVEAINTTLGANKQKALKFHGILANLLFIKAYR